MKTRRGSIPSPSPRQRKSRDGLLSGKASASKHNLAKHCQTVALLDCCGLDYCFRKAALLCQIILENCSTLHHKLYVAEFLHIFEWIAAYRDNVRISVWRNHSQFALFVQHLRRARMVRGNGFHRPQSKWSQN